MSSSNPKFFKTGTVVGTGSAINVSVPEFTPRKVILRNVDSGDEMTWVDTFPQGYGWKRLAAGTGSYVTSGGVSVTYQDSLGDGQDPGRGFSIGTDSDLNVDTEVLHWEAYE
jgi:hypothetical protein